MATRIRTGHQQYNRSLRLNWGHPSFNDKIVDIESSKAQDGFNDYDTYHDNKLSRDELFRKVQTEGNLTINPEPVGFKINYQKEKEAEQIVDNDDGVQKFGFKKLEADDKKEIQEEKKEEMDILPNKFGRGYSHTAKGGIFQAGKDAQQLENKEIAKEKAGGVPTGDDKRDDDNRDEAMPNKQLMSQKDREELGEVKGRMGKLSDRPQPPIEPSPNFWETAGL